MNLTLQFNDYAALSPILILLVVGLILLLVESFASPLHAKKFSFFIALGGIVAALLAAIYSPSSENALLTSWVRFDAFARFFSVFFLSIGLASVLLAGSFFQRFEATEGEYYFLMISCLLGLLFIALAGDFLLLFIGLETLSIALYVLCGYMKRWEMSHEAAMKYFLMGSIAAAFLLYGIALVYGAIGSTSFDNLLHGYQGIANPSREVLFLGGIILVTLGLAFKAAIVPFHVWAPDVYCGSPTPVTAFMAVGVKVGAFAALARIFLEVIPHFNPIWNEVIALLAYPTLIYANIVAIKQVQLRRFFAYSGISHAGFLILPLAAGTPDALYALVFYLVVYAIATFGAFAVVALLDRQGEGVMITDLKGLFKRSPSLAGLLTLCLLTLTGIPPTAGFFAKFYVFKVAFQAGYYGLVVVGLLTTILAAYYYLRIVAIMFSENPEEETTLRHSWPAVLVGAVSFTLLIVLSLYPGVLLI